MHISNIIGGASVTLDILLPDAWAEEKKKNGKAVWLLHDVGEASDTWMLNAQPELLANQYGVAVIAPSMGRLASYRDAEPGCTWETFFTKGLWDYVHEIIPAISGAPEDQLLFGRGAGAEAAIRFSRIASDRFGRAGAYRPSDASLEDWSCCSEMLRREIESFVNC